MKRLPILLLLAALLLAACHHNGRPSGVMGHDAMVGFLADAYLLEGFYAIETQYRYDALTPTTLEAYDSILDLHGVSREGVERSIDYYTHHLDEYEAIHQEVVARLESRRDSLGL